MSRRLTARPGRQTWPLLPSQAGLGGAHEDPTAVLAADHGVRVGVAGGGQLGAVQLDPAALAAPGLEFRGAGGAGLRRDAVVELEQVRRYRPGDLGALG